MRSNRYYVVALKSKGAVIGYAVNDCVHGMESQQVAFQQPTYTNEQSLFLANQWRDDANAKIT